MDNEGVGVQKSENFADVISGCSLSEGRGGPRSVWAGGADALTRIFKVVPPFGRRECEMRINQAKERDDDSFEWERGRTRAVEVNVAVGLPHARRTRKNVVQLQLRESGKKWRSHILI